MSSRYVTIPDDLDAMRAARDGHLLRRDEFDRQIKALQRKADLAEAKAATIDDAIGEKLIAMWGKEPDWRHMLAAEREGGQTIYKYADRLVQELGLAFSGGWSDTGEHAIAVALNRYDDRERYRVTASIRYLSSRMRMRRGNIVWFSIWHHDSSNSSWTLVYHPGSDRASLKQHVRCFERENIKFKSLDECMKYVQDNLWNDDEMSLDANGPHLIEGRAIEIAG